MPRLASRGKPPFLTHARRKIANSTEVTLRAPQKGRRWDERNQRVLTKFGPAVARKRLGKSDVVRHLDTGCAKRHRFLCRHVTRLSLACNMGGVPVPLMRAPFVPSWLLSARLTVTTERPRTSVTSPRDETALLARLNLALIQADVRREEFLHWLRCPSQRP